MWLPCRQCRRSSSRRCGPQFGSPWASRCAPQLVSAPQSFACPSSSSEPKCGNQLQKLGRVQAETVRNRYSKILHRPRSPCSSALVVICPARLRPPLLRLNDPVTTCPCPTTTWTMSHSLLPHGMAL